MQNYEYTGTSDLGKLLSPLKRQLRPSNGKSRIALDLQWMKVAQSCYNAVVVFTLQCATPWPRWRTLWTAPQLASGPRPLGRPQGCESRPAKKTTLTAWAENWPAAPWGLWPCKTSSFYLIFFEKKMCPVEVFGLDLESSDIMEPLTQWTWVLTSAWDHTTMDQSKPFECVVHNKGPHLK